MSISEFDLIIASITEEIEKERIEIASVLPNCRTESLEELENWWADAKKIFKSNSRQINLVWILYQASKASLLLKCDPFPPELYWASFKAIFNLSEHYQELTKHMMVKLNRKTAAGIKSSRSLNDLLEWFRTIKDTENIYDKDNFMCLIIGCLELFCYHNPKETLLFLAQSGIASEIDVNNLILKALEISVKQVENESKTCNLESFEKFKENVRELEGWIDMIFPNICLEKSIAEARHFLSQMLRSLDNSLREVQVSISESRQTQKKLKNSTDQGDALDKARITQESCILKYIGNYLNVYIHQGYLDGSKQICIKYFVLASKEFYEIFDKEKEITKFLSEKHSCFLKYYGWFPDIWLNANQKFDAFAIVTESFKTTLIEDIILRSRDQVKYSQYWFLENAKILLGAFSYLEDLKIPHFDIRPHNIFITDDNKLKISGFYFSGMALINNSDDAVKKCQDMWNDSYDAPELYNTQGFDRKEALNAIKAGVFSLGLVFLQMYSLCKITELNTSEFLDEIEDYVSTFKPLIVANLLVNMLKINRVKRLSFFECLQLFQQKEESKEEYKIIRLNMQISFQEFEAKLERLKKVKSSKLKPCKKNDFNTKTYENGLEIIFKKGKYMSEKVLIRTFESNEFRNLLPYIEEAEVLEKLNGKNPAFIKYYGLDYFYNDSKQLYCLSLITELCERNLINAITKRATNKSRYKEKKLLHYSETLLKGFIALKENRYDHDNISPHVLLFNSNSELKISGLITPKYKIKSICIFPNNNLPVFQSSSGYLSPEKCKSRKEGNKYSIEGSDIFSLGLVLLQMSILKPIDNWNNEQIFSNLQTVKPFWLSKLLERMLQEEQSLRLSFSEIYDEMQNYIRIYART